MKKLIGLALVFGLGMVAGQWTQHGGATATAATAGGLGAGSLPCSTRNGDMNADGDLNIADAVLLLRYLFQGQPQELGALCPTDLTLRIRVLESQVAEAQQSLETCSNALSVCYSDLSSCQP